MERSDQDEARQRLADVLAQARQMGADAADALFVEGRSVDVSWREGKLEGLTHAEGGDLGLRVFFGKRQASAATSDHSPRALQELVERVVSMARLAPEDPYCGLADPADISRDFPVFEMADDYQPDVESLIAKARAAEEAALSLPGVMPCDAAHAGAGETFVALAATNGFEGSYRRTGYSVTASALAGQGTDLERDYDYHAAVFQSDLRSPEDIGLEAGQRALRSLAARKMPSCQVPVVFDPRESNSLLGVFLGAISGAGVARGTSFLKDFMGKQVFAEEVTIVDDPFRARGLRSKIFDGEGMAPQRRVLVDRGVLQTWLLDLRSARQLGLRSTGHASRGTTGVPSPSATNACIAAGTRSVAALIADIQSGFYVTEMMGSGINGVTGDFSQAARGFWIENGQITHPVFEMTIAANLKDMFRNMAVADDLTHRYGVDAPTLRVEGMTVAGV